MFCVIDYYDTSTNYVNCYFFETGELRSEKSDEKPLAPKFD